MTRVPVYQWALPEDIAPLRALPLRAMAHGEVDMVLFTTSVQVIHLMEIAGSMNLGDKLREGQARMVIGSIGPVTSDELREQGFTPDFEPTHPKMGFPAVNARMAGLTITGEKETRYSQVSVRDVVCPSSKGDETLNLGLDLRNLLLHRVQKKEAARCRGGVGWECTWPLNHTEV